MALFDNLGKKIGDLATTTAKKSGEMIEVTKINLNINTEEDSIKKLYSEIGNYCYELFQQGPFQDGRINDLCSQIKTHKDKIQELKEKIYSVKGIVICKNCGAEIDNNTPFCSKCGSKIVVNEPPAEATETVEDDSIECPTCKAKVSGGSAFCSGCGTKVR
jgi:DNA-directed RNA polymerase subunit RPC12/RpoP